MPKKIMTAPIRTTVKTETRQGALRTAEKEVHPHQHLREDKSKISYKAGEIRNHRDKGQTRKGSRGRRQVNSH